MLYLPVFIAQDQGFFEKHGVKVDLVRFGSANEMAQALATDRIDVTGMSSLTVLANLERNSPGLFRIYLLEVLTEKLSPDALVVMEGSEVRSLEDLRGKKLGLHPGTTLRTYADRFLRSQLGENHGVTFVPLPPHLQVQSLESGSVDALYTLEPIPTLAVSKIKARIVSRGLLARYIHDPFYAGAGVVSANTLKERPEAISAYRAAIRDALKFISSNETEARTVMPKYASVSLEVAQHMSLVGWTEPRSVSLSDWRMAIKVLADMKLIPSEVTLEDAFLGN